jgi:hypothetical protein
MALLTNSAAVQQTVRATGPVRLAYRALLDHNWSMPNLATAELSPTFVLRTVYIDDSVDQALTTQSRSTGQTKATLFRRWLSVGIQAVRQGRRSRVPMPASTAPLILKTVHLSPQVDQLLRVQAFDEHVPKNDILRQYLNIGLELSSCSGST